MKFLIQNITNQPKSIVRFGGGEVLIPANDFIILDSDNASECTYWANVNKNNNVVGINAIIDTAKIRLYTKLKSCGKYNTIIGNNTVSETVTDTTTISEPIEEVVVEDNIKIDTNTITESVVAEIVEETTNESTIEENTITAEPVVVEETEPEEIVDDTKVEESVTETVEETTEPETIVEVDEPVELNDEVDAEPVTEELVEVEEINEQVEETTNTKLAYTEEELNTMSKADLQEICDTYGISYKKNNSISTLVGLIMEYQTNED
jgi:hypothetical protein